METIADDVRKARKNHICDYCGLIIEKGTMYDRQVNKDGGEVYTFKSHPSCAKLANDLGMFDWNDGVSSDDFRTEVQERYREIVIDNTYPKPPFEKQLEVVKNVKWISKNFLGEIIITVEQNF
jgi:hypothetical protein